MYCNFFGFSEKPFDVTPDPKFLYLSPDHREVLASLIYGVKERRGFITVIGEVGTGKTTLLNALLDRLDDKIKVAYLFNTDVTFEQMLNRALFEFGLSKAAEELAKPQAIHRLNDFAIKQLTGGGNVVLIVDEAQNLDPNCMENLRLLSNLETRKYKLIQIILSGQPELDAKLSQHELRQLAQRISLRRYVFPLREKDTYEYIQHRLAVANFKGSPLFDRRSQEMIWQYSKGIPRKINMICDNALLIGYGLKAKKIKKPVLEETVKDLTWSPFVEPKSDSTEVCLDKPIAQSQISTTRRRFVLPASMAIAACLLLFLALGILYPDKTLRETITLGPLGDFFTQATNTQQNVERATAPALIESYARPKAVQEITLLNSSNEQANLGADPQKNTSKSMKVAHSQVKESEGKRAVEPSTGGSEKVPSGIRQSRAHVSWDMHRADKPIVREDVRVQEAPAVPFMEDKLELFPTPAPVRREEVGMVTHDRTVTVREGDTLSEIIKEAYGKYDDQILRSVLVENPEIRTPDEIFTGQVLKLPSPVETF